MAPAHRHFPHCRCQPALACLPARLPAGSGRRRPGGRPVLHSGAPHSSGVGTQQGDDSPVWGGCGPGEWTGMGRQCICAVRAGATGSEAAIWLKPTAPAFAAAWRRISCLNGGLARCLPPAHHAWPPPRRPPPTSPSLLRSRRWRRSEARPSPAPLASPEGLPQPTCEST